MQYQCASGLSDDSIKFVLKDTIKGKKLNKILLLPLLVQSTRTKMATKNVTLVVQTFPHPSLPHAQSIRTRTATTNVTNANS